MIAIGNVARHLRESFGLTQRAAAKQLEVSVVHLCNVENDKSPVSADLLKRYRELWGVDLYVLAWCLHGETDSLPVAVRKPMRELGRAWKRELEAKGAIKRKEAQAKCSRSAK